ncbi:hypothetical protein HDK77DRAFT_379675 [Phyllosticta capitalensis]
MPPPLSPAVGPVIAVDTADARVVPRKSIRSQRPAPVSSRKPASPAVKLPVVLFGYEASTFTIKIRLALRLKQIPYTFVHVPVMAPRPLLRDSFALSYRKIPVLAIGRDIYVDTYLILEILEQRFPSPDFPTLYPAAEDGRTNRALIRLLTGYWADRPLFRVTTGLIPPRVWRSRFGNDRAQLIGHPLDAAKLARKIPENLAALDVQLNLTEAQLKEAGDQMQTRPHQANGPWLFSSSNPSAADLALFYQLKWGRDIAQGKGVDEMIAGPAAEDDKVPVEVVFNSERYPCVVAWFKRFETYVEALPKVEKVVEDPAGALRALKESAMVPIEDAQLHPVAPKLDVLAESLRLTRGATVSITPNDTGRDNPTVGILIDFSAEQVVVQPCHIDGKAPEMEVRQHFPRVGFVIRPIAESRL